MSGTNGGATTRVERPGAVSIPSSRPSMSALRAGRYGLLYLLGEGAMSRVYAAWDTRLERPVAIKELRVDVGASAATFEREARVLAAIRHRAVVTIFALHTDDGPPFLVMERVDGTTLERLLRERPPRLGRALEILRQTAQGLDAVHAAGLVHGDVKPSNVLIDRNGDVKIADVGLVPFLERMEPGEILGTPRYMPPERARGVVLPPSLAARSDVYSFAVTCFEVLTGRLPFAASAGSGLLRAHASLEAPRVSDVSDLSRVFDAPLARSLSKMPSMRHASCGELVAALEKARAGTDALGRALRILVVDDDPDVRASMSEALALHLQGATIEAASDGVTALASIKHDVPHVVLLDLSMPGLSGIELVAELRRVAPTVGILVVTGHGSGPEWRAARALGVYRFLVKPVEVDEVVRSIHELVDASPSISREGRAERPDPNTGGE